MIVGAHRNDSPLLRSTLENLARFDQSLGFGLPEDITDHLDADYDSAKTRDLLTELGCRGVISKNGFPIQAGKRWSWNAPTPDTTVDSRSSPSAPNTQAE